MLRVPIDTKLVDECRERAARIADDVQRFIDAHTTVGVERTVARALGVEGVDDQGTPLVNRLVDRIHQAGLLGHGVASFLGAPTQETAERLAYGSEPIAVPVGVAGAL